MIGMMMKRIYNFYCFCVRTDEPVAYVPSIKGKDQNAVVRLKDFQKLVDSIFNTSLKVLRYPREKTQPYTNNNVHHVRTASTGQRGVNPIIGEEDLQFNH
jgi:hypothetical protein